MTTPATYTKFGGALVAAFAACALLVPLAQARPVEGTTLLASDGAVERAVVQNQNQLGSVAGYRDAQHAQQQTSGAALYSDVERQLHLRADPPAASGGSADSTDWGEVGTFAALGALCAMLAAAALVSIHQRPRPI